MGHVDNATVPMKINTEGQPWYCGASSKVNSFVGTAQNDGTQTSF